MSDRIVEKVKKLLALAERAGTEEEAALAFEKAQELMQQHAIEQHQLGGVGLAADPKIVARRVVLKQRDETRKGKILLLWKLGSANRCKVVDNYDGATIYGTADDAEFVELLWTTVLIQMAGEQSRAWKAYKATDRDYRESRFRFVTGFATSFAVRVGERLKADADRRAAQAGPGSALVLIKQAAEDYVKNNVSTRTVIVKNRASAAAHQAGRSAADRADLSGGRGHVAAKQSQALR